MYESEEHHKGNKRGKTRVQNKKPENPGNDQRRCGEKLASEAQKAANLRNTKELYNTTSLLANEQFRSNKPIKDNENHLVNAIDQLCRWLECFRELFQNKILDGVDQPMDGDDEDVTEGRISSNTSIKSQMRQAIREREKR
ncbi:hypothetical protein HHI36_011495 [Cryptolaemus montrouzieri]|uniref:Uncharacterized protein n=1 Tax=Cryptolaemus montrouzieri TaxID=559131 RepID=A0ABD2MMB4_9CUCU